MRIPCQLWLGFVCRGVSSCPKRPKASTAGGGSVAVTGAAQPQVHKNRRGGCGIRIRFWVSHVRWRTCFSSQREWRIQDFYQSRQRRGFPIWSSDKSMFFALVFKCGSISPSWKFLQNVTKSFDSVSKWEIHVLLLSCVRRGRAGRENQIVGGSNYFFWIVFVAASRRVACGCVRSHLPHQGLPIIWRKKKNCIWGLRNRCAAMHHSYRQEATERERMMRNKSASGEFRFRQSQESDARPLASRKKKYQPWDQRYVFVTSRSSWHLCFSCTWYRSRSPVARKFLDRPLGWRWTHPTTRFLFTPDPDADRGTTAMKTA